MLVVCAFHNVSHKKVQSIIERYVFSSGEFIGVVGYCEDEDESRSVNLAVREQFAEAEDMHCAQCQSLHNEYRMFVSDMVIQEPKISELAHEDYCNIILLPHNEFTRDNLTTIQNSERFFSGGLEEIFRHGLGAAVADL